MDNREEETPKAPYAERPVTMGTLQMWIPIVLSVVGLAAVVITNFAAQAVSNAGRLTKLETIAEQRVIMLDAITADVNKLNIVTENHSVKLQQYQAQCLAPKQPQ